MFYLRDKVLFESLPKKFRLQFVYVGSTSYSGYICDGVLFVPYESGFMIYFPWEYELPSSEVKR